MTGPQAALLAGLGLPFVVVNAEGRVSNRSDASATAWAQVGESLKEAPPEWRRALACAQPGPSPEPDLRNPIRGVRLDEEVWLVQVLDARSLAAIAHEVKNPVAAVAGALTILNQRAPEGSPERSVIAEMQARLLSLTDRLDAWSHRIRPVVPHREPVRLLDLVHAAEHALKKRAPRFELGQVDVPDLEVRVDRQLCVEALRLLLTPWASGPAPNLQASVASGRVVLTVRSEPPERLDEEAAAQVQRIASAHGGALIQGSTRAYLGVELEAEAHS